MNDLDKQFKVPDIIMEYKRKRIITSSTCMLYVYLCLMFNIYGEKEWFYVSTKMMMDKFNIKRATYFNSKKRLIKYKLLLQNKQKHIKIPALWSQNNETK